MILENFEEGQAYYWAVRAFTGMAGSSYSFIGNFVVDSNNVCVSCSSLRLSPGEDGSCAIGGGVGPYSATSSHSGVVQASSAGSKLYYSAASVGNATISVWDSAGHWADVSVTVLAGSSPTHYTNSLGMTFIWIPAGSFTMGSPQNEPAGSYDERPLHQVTLTESFFMQETEVTQAQWKAVMGNNPSDHKSCPDCPVENVSWDDAQAFITRINMRGEGIYALPTEAQWEYAARAGTSTAFYNGGITNTDCGYDPNLNAIGWYCNHPDRQSQPVAQKAPNAFGLYDMSGNVKEWCQDWYLYVYYSRSPSVDPTGPATGDYRILRGGGWYSRVEKCRSASRSFNYPDVRLFDIGFRLTLTLGR